MLISLIDVDGGNFPNLALMKLSAWHKLRGDTVKFHDPLFDTPDILYASKVFTFSKDYDYYPDNTIKGGTGYKKYEIVLPEEVEHTCPDYSLYNSESAIGFLTRGCIRNCSFCVVPKKEGSIRANADIAEFLSDKKSAILLDNNVLSHKHGLSQIEKIIDLGIKIDFNQGLDARIISENNDIAKLLARVKWLKPLRMACDSENELSAVLSATEKLRKYGAKPQRFFVYVLVKDIETALIRVNELKKNNLDPFAQSYIDFNNGYVDNKLKKFSRWVNRKAIFKSVEWCEYNRR